MLFLSGILLLNNLLYRTLPLPRTTNFEIIKPGEAGSPTHLMSEEPFDFFISYTSVDEPWAKWIAWTLEEKGYSTRYMDCNFGPGNFVEKMHQSVRYCQCIIPLLSEAYLNHSDYGPIEWQSIVPKDPKGEKGLIIPVVLEDINNPGLLGVYANVDFREVNSESKAKRELFKLVSWDPGKSKAKPTFPNRKPDSPSFPGSHSELAPKSNPFERPDMGHLLPFMANRKKFIRTLRELIREQDKDTKRPVVCIIHGNEHQCQDMLFKRLTAVALPDILGKDKPIIGKPMSWINADEFTEALQVENHYKTQFCHLLSIPATLSETDIITAFSSSKSTWLFWANFIVSPDQYNQIDLCIQKIIHFWESFSTVDPPSRFIFFLSIKCIQSKKRNFLNNLFGRSRNNTELHQFISNLEQKIKATTQIERPIWKIFDELEWIVRQDVEELAMNDDFREHFDRIQPHIHKIFEKDDKLTMQDLADAITSITENKKLSY